MERKADGRRWPGAGGARRSKISGVLVAVLLAGVAAGIVIAAGGGAKTARPSAATLPPATKGAKWVAGTAGTLLASVSNDLGRLGAAGRAGQHTAAEDAGGQLAADAKAALGGPMPPVDAALYRAGLISIAKAGAEISNGNIRAATAALATGNADIATVTAAANTPPPADGPAQAGEPGR